MKGEIRSGFVRQETLSGAGGPTPGQGDRSNQHRRVGLRHAWLDALAAIGEALSQRNFDGAMARLQSTLPHPPRLDVDMPSRFETYGPELTKLMKEAFDEALATVVTSGRGVDRILLASTIIDAVEARVFEVDEIVIRAVATLTMSLKPGS